MTAKHNILFLMNGAKPPRGGEFLVFYIIVNLNKELFHPIVIYAGEGMIVKMIEQEGIDTIHVPLSDNITTPYLGEIIYNPIKSSIYLINLLKSKYYFRLKRVIKNGDIDLIYSADTFSKIVGGIIGRQFKINVIGHCHADFSGPLFTNRVGKFLKIVDLLFLNRIIAVSEKVRNCFKQNKAYSKVVTIQNGIDINIYDSSKVDDGFLKELDIHRDQIVIGVIGAIEKFRGHIYLIEALEKLKTENIGTILTLIVGTGIEEGNLKKIINDKGLDQEVLFLGFRKDVPRILKVLNILVLPSFHESSSMISMEAMAMDVPVIATNVGGLPEVIENGSTGILIPPGDVDALYQAIKYLIKNPEVRKKMGENARARVLEHFTIEKNVRKTEEVFLEMLRGV